MLQNQKVLIGVIVVLVFLIVGGGAWFVMSRNQSQTLQAQQTSDSTQQQPVVGTLRPSDIGLQMQLSQNNQKVAFTAGKLDGVKSLEWNFSYQADIPPADQTADNVGQKVTQEFGSDQPVILNGKTSYSSTPRELGTCSSGHCRYDTGVTSVQLELKVTKDDGKVYKVDDSINL